MYFLKALNSKLSRFAMYVACICLIGLLSVVIYGVIMRYVFNNAPPYVEQVALLLVISVAMFGAAAGVRDAGHIGLDSIVRVLPHQAQFWCSAVVTCGWISNGAFDLREHHPHTWPVRGLPLSPRRLSRGPHHSF